MNRVKTITSYAGLARYIAELSEDAVSYIARADVAAISSPYRYSPALAVYVDASGRRVVWFETRHKHYEVFAVEGVKEYATDDEATDAHIAATRAA